MITAITICVVALALSCYFAASHIALRTFSRKRLGDLLEARGQAEQLEMLTDHLPKLQLIAASLRAGFCLILLLAVHELIRLSTAGWQPTTLYATAFLITAALVIIFVVAIPASWARYGSERLLARSLPLLSLLLTVFRPLASALQLADPFFRRLAGANGDENGNGDISEQVLNVVEDHDAGNSVDEEQKEMLEAVFELPTTDVDEIMTPRTDIDGIAMSATLDEVKRAALEMGHSRIPVYEQSLDHITGILYVKDLIQLLGNHQPFDLKQLLREPLLVPRSKSIRDLLAEFKAQKVHIAIVVDEYGGTAGLITIEDILEEIVGEIHDEYEAEEESELIQPIDADAAEVDARLHVDDLNDHFRIQLPEDQDYDTVGGFVVTTLGHIPREGESFHVGDLRFTVTAAERTKVLKVKVERLAAAES